MEHLNRVTYSFNFPILPIWRKVTQEVLEVILWLSGHKVQPINLFDISTIPHLLPFLTTSVFWEKDHPANNSLRSSFENSSVMEKSRCRILLRTVWSWDGTYKVTLYPRDAFFKWLCTFLQLINKPRLARLASFVFLLWMKCKKHFCSFKSNTHYFS